MTLDYESAARLYDLAKEYSVSLCVDHNHLFDPWMLKGKEALKGLKHEDIVYVESYYGINAPDIGDHGLPGSPTRISWIFSLRGVFFTTS